MTAWLPLLLPVLGALCILALLGLPVALGLRARGFMVAVVTVPAAFASIAVSSIVAPLIGVSWSLIAPFGLSLAFGITLWLLTQKSRRLTPLRVTPHWGFPLLAVVFVGAITTHTLSNGIPAAGSISQTYDAVFHLNATKLVLDSGVASPFSMDLSSPGNAAFYPTLWHATTALITQVSGASIAVATNAMTFVTASVIWGIGAVALGRAVAGSGRIATLTSGIIASVFPTLPIGLAAFGVLYPNFLAMTLIPYVLVGCAQLFNTGPARNADPISPFTRVMLTIGALGAATLAHPNALHAVFILTIGFAITMLIVRVQHAQPRFTWLPSALLAAAFILVGIALWLFGRTSMNPWGGSQGPFGAIIEALGTAPRFDGHNWIVTIFLLTGIVLAVLRLRLLPYLIAYIVTVAFYVLADGFPPNPIREFFLSPWYSDPWRLAAILPIAMLPLTVAGLSTTIKILHPAYMRVASFVTQKRQLTLAGSSALLLISGLALTATSLYPSVAYVGDRYGADTTDARVLSNDEATLLERLDQVVPEEARILVNPWNGGALAYALGNRDVTLPHMTGSYDEEIWIASQGIAFGTEASCNAAEDLNATHVLDFGTRYIFAEPDFRKELEGITDITTAPALTEIDRQGSAVLYEITGCGWKETP